MRNSIAALLVLLFGLLLAIPVSGQEEVEVRPPAGAAEFSYQRFDDDKLLISVADSEGRPLRNLTIEDFVVMRDARRAQILSAEPLETSDDVSLNIVMVVDNSASMRRRNAVKPIIQAMESLFAVIRPIDTITVVVFSDREQTAFGDYRLHVKTKQSRQIDELRAFVQESFARGLTDKTVLYEGMLAGLSVLYNLPANAHKFMVVFTDGEDINSAFRGPVVAKAAEGLEKFEAYAIDYMPSPGTDPFLRRFTESHGGRIWKATAADELAPIFQTLMSKLLYRYVVTYRFLHPPTGSLTLMPDTVNVEEITTIESAPLLNYVYFNTGQSSIPPRYVLFRGQDQAAAFDLAALRGTLEKYHNVLNIVGQRLTDVPEATIRIVGCNAGRGPENGRIDLSRGRAEAVKGYLQYIWGIDPARMKVEARNLPKVASSRGTPEGRQENQRVEIHADRDAILDVVTSTYAEFSMDVTALQVQPRIIAAHGLYGWRVTLIGDETPIGSFTGTGRLEETLKLPADKFPPRKFASCRQLKAEIEVEDMEGQIFTTASNPVRVNLIRRETQQARDLGFKVQEKYALILFDFNSDAIKARNEAIVKQIVARIDALPELTANIVGHTDNIGNPDYNLDLSQRRARAVFKQIAAVRGGDPGEGFSYSGVGPIDPLFSNDQPENRALNRTVTITLLYEQKD